MPRTLPRKAVIVIPCHNQQATVELCIERLEQQTVKPVKIIVMDDHSDRRPDVDSSITVVVGANKRGRSSTRNLGMEVALTYGPDVIIFLDGDAIPADTHFIENHLARHSGNYGNSLVFGLRQHIPRPRRWGDYTETSPYDAIDITKLPSDLLTANMDTLVRGMNLDYTDLRVVSGAYKAFNESVEFSEKCDLVLSGMITWSCNFSIGFLAASTIRNYMLVNYGMHGWFDDCMFSDGWGYEDVALGVDALFAGVQLSIGDDMQVKHFMHERSDELSSHILGRHRIMERYRKLLATTKRKGGVGHDHDVHSMLMANGYSVVLSAHSLNINGRVITLPPKVKGTRKTNTLLMFGKKMYVNGYVVDVPRGTFSMTPLGLLLSVASGT